MAKATLTVELKTGNIIEMTMRGKGIKPVTHRFEHATAAEASAAMVRGMEAVLKIANGKRAA